MGAAAKVAKAAEAADSGCAECGCVESADGGRAVREVTGMGWLHMRSTQIRPGKYRGRLHIPPCTSARYYSSS